MFRLSTMRPAIGGALLLTASVFPFQTAQVQSQNSPRVLAAPQTVIRARQGTANLAALEANMLRRVNEVRRRMKLGELKLDPLLAEVARAHSLEMRDKNYFAHESPTAGLVHPLDRYRAAFRQTPAIVAENIYRSWSTARKPVTETDLVRGHNALLNSPGHRRNLLEPRVTRIGIGIVQNSNGDIWLTQMFSRPTW